MQTRCRLAGGRTELKWIGAMGGLTNCTVVMISVVDDVKRRESESRAIFFKAGGRFPGHEERAGQRAGGAGLGQLLACDELNLSS